MEPLTKLNTQRDFVFFSSVFSEYSVVNKRICTNKVTLTYGKRILFEDVHIKYTSGNFYRLIGTNSSGKYTYLKILAGDIEIAPCDVIDRLMTFKEYIEHKEVAKTRDATTR